MLYAHFNMESHYTSRYVTPSDACNSYISAIIYTARSFFLLNMHVFVYFIYVLVLQLVCYLVLCLCYLLHVYDNYNQLTGCSKYPALVFRNDFYIYSRFNYLSDMDIFMYSISDLICLCVIQSCISCIYFDTIFY